MNVVFADTSYYVALLLRTDSRHQRAIELTAAHAGPVVTAEWVLAELGNFLCPRSSRRYFSELVQDLQHDSGVTIIPVSHQSFLAALTLYHERADQSWSFIDCVSFAEMNSHSITDAWTTDHHFEQAGFKSLLK